MDKFKKVFNKLGDVMFVFPHFDDCAFVSSGLIQVLNKQKVGTKVTVFYENELSSGVEEFKKYCEYLDITKVKLIKTTHQNLKRDLEEAIKNDQPNVVVTFDPGGVTGNSHHTLISLKTYEVLQGLGANKPKLLWRVADSEEARFFGKMPNPLGYKYSSLIKINLSLSQSLKKIRSILINKSVMKGFFHKLRIIEWYLLDHKEDYYLVNFKKDRLQVNYLNSKQIVD